jgi:hypothetical protein
MSKLQIIEAIRLKNRTANQAFLIAFDRRSLANYLKRLTTLDGHRGPASRWVRTGDTAAIVRRAH